jgi:C_GCAxxG_C_C family probable redox protein
MASTAEKARELGEQYERTCTGCAQTTLAAVMDALGKQSEDAFRAASGLADGIGLSGDGSCGALTGGAMAIGLASGRTRKDFNDPLAAMTSYLLVRELVTHFQEHYGSCRCHDIQKKLMGRTFNLLDPKEMEEALEFGMLEHCARVVGDSAKTSVEIILKHQNG